MSSGSNKSIFPINIWPRQRNVRPHLIDLDLPLKSAHPHPIEHSAPASSPSEVKPTAAVQQESKPWLENEEEKSSNISSPFSRVSIGDKAESGRGTSRTSISSPESLGEEIGRVKKHRHHQSNGQQIDNCESMSIRINSEFEKNMFFADHSQLPITTKLLPEDVFEELDFLGTGSGGNVLKMRHKPTGKICAVKQMRRTLNNEENKRIFMDLQVVLKCECDNIVRCCGYFIKESEVWICMELMTTCFDKLLKSTRKPLPEKFIGAIAASAVKALYYLKENHNIMHRDVKPSNILINDEGQIKLCDFGISGRLIDSLAKTRAAGCIPYMAPERIDSNTSYDTRADIWSLGITLYELATGKSPYGDCPTEFVILVKVVEEDPPRLPDNMDFSDDFRDFIRVCLTKDYKLRPKYKQLIEHRFIVKHMNTIVNLKELY